MNLSVHIDGVNRTDRILFPFITITDNINHHKDLATFRIRQESGLPWKPEVNSEVIINDGGTRIFGGVIVGVTRKAVVANLVEYEVECSDYSFYLDRRLVLERYRSKTVSFIIDDLLETYDTTGFTVTNVQGTETVGSIAFNRITISEALQKLADAFGYSWYVDYHKDIHFFPKNQEPAPYNLTDTSNNFVWTSLEVEQNINQLRNAVFVEGGDERGNLRLEEFVASGDDENRRYYRLAHKFAETPTVMVGLTEQTVGVEFLSDDADFDCMWSFGEKYIRFTDGNIPATSAVVTVEGIPLFPVVVRVQDPSSVVEYGLWEYVIRDYSIKSRNEGIQRATAELEAYKNGVVEAQFETYTPGLRSGQVITINSPIRDINEEFLIQKVRFQVETRTSGRYVVELATLRTVSIVDLLQMLMIARGFREGEQETLLSFLQFADQAGGSDSIDSITTTEAPYYYATATVNGNEGKWNYSRWT